MQIHVHKTLSVLRYPSGRLGELHERLPVILVLYDGLDLLLDENFVQPPQPHRGFANFGWCQVLEADDDGDDDEAAEEDERGDEQNNDDRHDDGKEITMIMMIIIVVNC